MLSFFRKKPSIEDEIKNKKLSIVLIRKELESISVQLQKLEDRSNVIKKRVVETKKITVGDESDMKIISMEKGQFLTRQRVLQKKMENEYQWINQISGLKDNKDEIQSGLTLGEIMEQESFNTFNQEMAKQIAKNQYIKEKVQSTASMMMEDVNMLRDNEMVEVSLPARSAEMEELEDVLNMAFEETLMIQPRESIDQEIYLATQRLQQYESEHRQKILATTVETEEKTKK